MTFWAHRWLAFPHPTCLDGSSAVGTEVLHAPCHPSSSQVDDSDGPGLCVLTQQNMSPPGPVGGALTFPGVRLQVYHPCLLGTT